MAHDKQTIVKDLIGILEEMSSGWESAFESSIGPRTRLGADLDFKSITLVQLIVAIQKHFDRQDLPFQDLFMPNGQVVKDLSVDDLSEFLNIQLNS